MSCCTPTTKEERKFRPNYNYKSLTEKFYARHDQIIEKPEAVSYYEFEIERRQLNDLHDIYPVPVTENQVYGWLEEQQIRYAGELDREIMFKPKKVDEELKIMQVIACEVIRTRLSMSRK